MSLGKYRQIKVWLEHLKFLLDRDTAKEVIDKKFVQGERGKCPKCKTPVSRAEDRFHCGTCGQHLSAWIDYRMGEMTNLEYRKRLKLPPFDKVEGESKNV